ncbi:MAG: tetratricopeptide repeat protein [Isosphaeraceae bacterium]
MMDRTPPSPLPADELRERAYRLYQGGDASLAEEICGQLLAENPRCAEAVYLLAVISLDRGRSQESYARFSQAAQLAPDNAVFVNALGEAHQATDRSENAAACFRQAIALRPGYERAHNNLGLFLHARGDFAAAGACFSEAIRLNPNYATAHNNLGAALHAQGRFDEAAAHFQEAIRLRPDYPDHRPNRDAARVRAEFQRTVRDDAFQLHHRRA